MATVYFTATSLDGFIADDQHSLQWLFEVPQTSASEQSLTEFVAGTGAIVMGASTYGWMLDHHGYLGDPAAWQADYGDRPTWVLTHRDLPPVPGAPVTVGPRDVRDLHPELVAGAGDRHVWVMGGGDVAGQFLDAGLLDEVHVGIAPVTLRAGAPLLPRRLLSDRLSLRTVEQVGQFALLVYDVR